MSLLISVAILATSAIGASPLQDVDIRNALLGHTAWGIHGYSPEATEGLIACVLCK